MAQFLKGVPCSREGLDLATRRYFEVIFCDEMDLFIYLFGFSRRFIRGVKIGEGFFSQPISEEVFGSFLF
jgi:hypothetical protein